MKKHFYRCRFIYAAFFISALIITAVMAGRGIWPFGGRSILRVDLFHQYAPYLEEFRSRVLSGKSLIYSWETGLGKDFLAQTAYYTTSPLNLLYFLFPRHLISEAVALIILLKISLSSSSFTWYLREHFHRNDVSILVFGLLYGFCAFVTCYYWNIMWMDTVALFPVVILGVERLTCDKKITLYYVSLLLTMIVNFYLAVIVCILLTLYYIVYTLSNFSLREDFRQILKNTGRFILVSVLCAMTALFILAPVGTALMNTAVSNTAFPGFSIYKGAWQVINAHFLGARASVLSRNEDMPNLYTGVLSVMMLPFFFGSRTIPRKEKLLYTLFLVFMLMCSFIMPLDFMIHGFHFPANLPHRFTFVYSFILLIMAYRGFTQMEKTSVPLVAAAVLFNIAAVLLYEFKIVNYVEEIDHVLSNSDLWLNLILTAVYLALLIPCALGAGKRFLVPALLVPVIFECSFTMFQNLSDTGNRAEYIAYFDDTDKALEYMREQEPDFFRTEFRRFITINDGSLYHYNGFAQFSSLAPGGISSLMEHLGIAATGNSYRYYDPTSLIDAIFGVRYVMNKDAEFPPAAMAFKYSFDKQFDSVWVYRNDRVLPLGFMTSDELLNWNTIGTDPFDVQNGFVRNAAGTDGDLFTLIEPESFSTENMQIEEISGINDISYTLTDPGNLSLEPKVHAEFVSDKDQYIYLYVDAPNAKRFIYANNTVKEDRELSAGRSLIDVGFVTEGERIVIDFSLTRRGEFEKTYRANGSVKLLAACYNDEVFQKAYDTLSKAPLEITDFQDTRITGTINAKESGILFTSIPFIPGWKAYVDGQETETTGIGNGGLLGLQIPEGEHSILLEYHSPHLLPAAAGSLLGLLLFLFFRKRYNN